MRWLELLGIVPIGDSQALRLTDPDPWEVGGTRDAAAFYRALEHLLTPTAVLYLEGSTEQQVPRLLRSLPSTRRRQVAIGTIWPRSDQFHVQATPGTLKTLADLIDRAGIALPGFTLTSTTTRA